jgi:hypothetical protein
MSRLLHMGVLHISLLSLLQSRMNLASLSLSFFIALLGACSLCSVRSLSLATTWEGSWGLIDGMFTFLSRRA